MNDMLQVVLDHDPEAVIDAFEVEIVGLRKRLNTADRELENVRFAYRTEIDALKSAIEQRDNARTDEEASKLALAVALNPDHILEIARMDGNVTNKIIAIKRLREYSRYGSSPNTRNEIGLREAKMFVEAIWQVRDEAEDRMRQLCMGK